MLIRRLALALLLGAPALPTFAVTPVLAPIQAEAAFGTAELMQATALDTVFSQFADTLASTPEARSIPGDVDFMRAWHDTAFEVFDATELHAQLAGVLHGKLSDTELAALATFYRSDFGKRLTAIERAISELPVEGQMTARDEGAALMAETEAGSAYDLALTEMMELVSADITRAMVGQSVRGMLVGMSMAQERGDIEVPWEEIDAQLAQILPAMDAEIESTQRAMMAYAYKDLADGDLAAYLTFLRTDAARKFYALAGYAIGTVVTGAMSEFGEELARRLAQVNV